MAELQSKTPRTKMSKQDVIDRDAAIRARPFKSKGSEELFQALLRIAKKMKERIMYASERGQRRGEGIETSLKRKNCNIKRKVKS